MAEGLADGGAGAGVPGLTLGTAGHIDHGKTALIEALTGINTDRLAEERRRGISIELGFAELELPRGGRLSVVDVPGHERLVRTMVAGATGIDLFLLVVAADDGVMPQTREHRAVLRALGVDRGIVAVTKVDTVDADACAGARAQAVGLVPDSPVVEVSARTGEGLEELREELEALALATERRALEQGRGPLLHIDRVFTLRGIGTVVTGTLQSGEVARGDRVDVLPRGLAARVRSVQVHGSEPERAAAGRRVALALSGVDRAEIERGDVIAAPGAVGLAPSYRLDVDLRLEPAAGSLGGKRVQVHHGTRDVPARVVELSDDGLAQLRLEAPLVARAGDRFVLRRIAPADTLGGGVVLDPGPPRHGAGAVGERLRRVRAGAAEAAEAVDAPPEAAAESPADAVPEPSTTAEAPLDRRAVLTLALLERDDVEPRGPAAIAQALRIQPEQAMGALERLVDAGRAVRVKPELYYSKARLDAACQRAIGLARERGELTLPGLRDALGTSRKYAQALLDHLDASKVTVRHGDRHVLRRPH